MFLRNKLLLASTALCAVMALTGPAHAETVVTKTTVEQTTTPGLAVDFMTLDTNHDGIYSMAEVGEKLFYLFDTDGNEVIDNIEYEQAKMMTIIPMQKETVTKFDLNNDGIPEQTTYTTEGFIQQSGLMRFDGNMDGLSPHEFVNTSFLKLDLDKSKAIELDEWKDAYIASLSPRVANQEIYND